MKIGTCKVKVIDNNKSRQGNKEKTDHDIFRHKNESFNETIQ